MSACNADTLTGFVFNIQRLSTHDGPGLRTTAFFKGCPLRCKWCHNPEGIDPRWENGWNARKCIGCGTCVAACPQGALARREDGGILIRHDLCTRCEACVKACPSGALTGYGKHMTPQALCTELIKDKAYFDVSGGGVTLSGGEPLLQADFAREVALRLKEADVHVALDTCLCVEADAAEKVLSCIDMALVDIKAIDRDLHLRCVGAPNDLLFKNLAKYADAARQGKLKLVIRTPVIPGYTDGVENLTAIGEYIVRQLAGAVESWELLLFHNMCGIKYDELGRRWPLKDTALIGGPQLEAIRRTVDQCGFDHDKIKILGLAASQTDN